MLIKRVDEVDPLSCPHYGGQMKVVAFIEPPQSACVEKILQHCGLWQASAPRAPPDVDSLVLELDAAFSDSILHLDITTGQIEVSNLTLADRCLHGRGLGVVHAHAIEVEAAAVPSSNDRFSTVLTT